MAIEKDVALLSARLTLLENALSITDGKLTLSVEGATIQLSKFGVKIECTEFSVKTSNQIIIKGGGVVTIKGSQVNLN